MSGIATVGLISDTHGLLRPEALAALAGSDLIIHAGDVGDAAILDRLLTIAPLVAVRGNIDRDPWASQLPATAVVEAGSGRIYILHDVKQLDLNPAAADFNVVVSGHSHQPGSSERAGVLYVNPGSAGPRRFRLPVTLARLNVAVTPCTVEFVHLSESPAGTPSSRL